MFVSDHKMIRVTGERVRHADRACLAWTSACWGRGQDIINKTESKFPNCQARAQFQLNQPQVAEMGHLGHSLFPL